MKRSDDLVDGTFGFLGLFVNYLLLIFLYMLNQILHFGEEFIGPFGLSGCVQHEFAAESPHLGLDPGLGQGQRWLFRHTKSAISNWQLAVSLKSKNKT